MKLSPRSFPFIALFSILAACSSPTSEPAESQQENKDFYPVRAYIAQELKELDSLPVAVFRYGVSGQVKDTQLVDKAAFRAMAEKLASPDISLEPLKKSYQESVYMDNTLNLVTLSYRAKDPSLEIQKLDVYVTPEKDRVKNIYLEKRSEAGDSVVFSKIIWTTGKQLQVTRIVSRQGKEDQVIQEKYSWAMPQ
jgi:hypothetical protein